MKTKRFRMTVSYHVKVTKENLRVLLKKTIINHPDTSTRLYLNHMIIYSNSIDSNYAYATVFTRYAEKILQVVLSKRDFVPFPTDSSRARLVTEGIDRLFTRPFSTRYVLEDLYFHHVYDRYL